MNPRPCALPPRLAAAIAGICCALLAAPAAAERLSIRTFTAGDGLGSSFVSDVMQDSAGYLWFATRDGLSRWNGYEFVTLAQSSGFSTPAIDRIMQSRSGEYFVICNDGALYSYMPPRAGEQVRQGAVAFTRRHVLVEGQEVSLTRLYEDRRGVLWGGGHGIVIKGVGTTNTLIRLNGPLPSSKWIVTALLDDGAGSMWVGTESGLLRLGPDGSRQRYSFAPRSTGDSIHALALDAAGRVWIGHSWAGVIVLNPGPHQAGETPAPQGSTSQVMPVLVARASRPRPAADKLQVAPRPGEAIVLDTRHGLPDNDVTSLLAASDGQVWIGTGRGLARFDGTTFFRYSTDNGLCDKIIHSLHEDGDHHVWVATPSGAMRIVPEGFARYSMDEGLANDWTVSIGEAPDGRVYAVGIDWSINVFDGVRFRASRLPLPKGSTLMWASQSAFHDTARRWWAVTAQGLYRFAPERPDPLTASRSPDRFYTARDGLPSSQIFRVFEDRSGALWVGTRSTDAPENGLARLDPTLTHAMAFGAADGFTAHVAPTAFAEDSRGNLWIGFYQGGLARYRDGRFRMFTQADGIPPGMITALLVDRKGRLWISTNLAGFGVVEDPSGDPPVVRMYSTRSGLASNNIRVMAEDHLGRIFAGHARGIDRLDPETGRVRRYGPDDGLSKDFVLAAFCDSRGDLWFGTYGGIFRLRAERERDEEPTPIVVTGVHIDGEDYPVPELGQASVGEMVLDADQRDIAVEFLSVSRHSTRGLTYQYSMDGGRDESWSAPSAERTVNFARLSPGRYVFSVRAVTPTGRVSAMPATVAFTIRPPVWQRWWFLAMALAGAAAVLLGLYRYRVRKLLEIERLRLGIASDLHDEVATNLSSIAMFSTLVRDEIPGPSPFLDRITVLATQSVEAIREIIWSIDPKPETIGDLLVRLRDAMVTTCRARGIRLTIVMPSQGMGQNLTPEQRKNLWLMLKEAVTNAVKHSGGSELTVTVSPAGRQVRLVVRDNGREPSPTTESSGRGLETMRARAEALGGTMTIEPVPGGGTAVEFLVKLAI